MGKNQGYKAMQRARVGSASGGPEDQVEDGMVDGSFHSPEWHAARLASLNKSHTVTWEEYKKKQKEDEMKKGELEADKDQMMREYRAQLDAERAKKLARGSNHSISTSSHKKEKKESSSKHRKSKKRKHSKRKLDSSSSSSSSGYSSSSDEGDDGKESRRSKSRSKRSKKEKKHRSKSKHPKDKNENENDTDGPVPLSKFFGSVKSLMHLFLLSTVLELHMKLRKLIIKQKKSKSWNRLNYMYFIEVLTSLRNQKSIRGHKLSLMLPLEGNVFVPFIASIQSSPYAMSNKC